MIRGWGFILPGSAETSTFPPRGNSRRAPRAPPIGRGRASGPPSTNGVGARKRLIENICLLYKTYRINWNAAALNQHLVALLSNLTSKTFTVLPRLITVSYTHLTLPTICSV